jgi:hypothetical protein
MDAKIVEKASRKSLGGERTPPPPSFHFEVTRTRPRRRTPSFAPIAPIVQRQQEVDLGKAENSGGGERGQRNSALATSPALFLTCCCSFPPHRPLRHLWQPSAPLTTFNRPFPPSTRPSHLLSPFPSRRFRREADPRRWLRSVLSVRSAEWNSKVACHRWRGLSEVEGWGEKGSGR